MKELSEGGLRAALTTWLRPKRVGFSMFSDSSTARVAARRLKIKEIDLSVAKRSDDQMLRIMIQENATQRGHNAASTLDSVAAAMGQIIYLALSGEFPGNLCNSLDGLKKIQGRIEAGLGIGDDLIHAFLPPNSLTPSEVREAVAIIKASDKHLDIIKRVRSGKRSRSSEVIVEDGE